MPTPTGCGPGPTPCWWGRGRCGPTIPALTVRLPPGDPCFRGPDEQPLRVVLGTAPAGAAVAPALELGGDLGRRCSTSSGAGGSSQLLVEGGATVAHAFHHAGLVDRYVLYLAPALFGGDDARPLFDGPGAADHGRLWRGQVRSVTSLEGDLEGRTVCRRQPEDLSPEPRNCLRPAPCRPT